MEIYFYSGIVQNPVPFMDCMWKKHSLEQKMDGRFGGHVIYISPQGVEMNFNSKYVRLI